MIDFRGMSNSDAKNLLHRYQQNGRDRVEKIEKVTDRLEKSDERKYQEGEIMNLRMDYCCFK